MGAWVGVGVVVGWQPPLRAQGSAAQLPQGRAPRGAAAAAPPPPPPIPSPPQTFTPRGSHPDSHAHDCEEIILVLNGTGVAVQQDKAMARGGEPPQLKGAWVMSLPARVLRRQVQRQPAGTDPACTCHRSPARPPSPRPHPSCAPTLD